MIKNFDCFTDTVEWEMPDNKITLDLSGGEKWKALRKVLSPTFTSGKLKTMLEPMDTVVDNLLKHLDQEVVKDPVVSVKSIFQTFSLDTISVCAFGIGANSFEDEQNQILQWGKETFSAFICKTWIESVFTFIIQHFTFLTKFMNLYPEAYDKLYAVTKQIMEERTLMNVEKEDFIGKLNRII
jgi:cytochrome P450 family 6